MKQTEQIQIFLITSEETEAQNSPESQQAVKPGLKSTPSRSSPLDSLLNPVVSLPHFHEGQPKQSGPAAVRSYVKLLKRTSLPSVHEKLAKAQYVGHWISLGLSVLSLYHTKVG